MSSQGNKLQKLRKNAGFETAKAFAERLEIPTSTYARYEQSPDGMPLKAAWKIADLLNCSIDDVVGRKTTSSKSSKASRMAKRIGKLSKKYRRSLLDYLDFLEEKNEEELNQELSDAKRELFSFLHKCEVDLYRLSKEDDYFSKKLRSTNVDNYREVLEEYIALEMDAKAAAEASALADEFTDHYQKQHCIKRVDDEGNVVAIYEPKKALSEEESKDLYSEVFKAVSRDLGERNRKYLELIMMAYDEKKQRENERGISFVFEDDSE